MSSMTSREREIRRSLRDSLPRYAAKCLMVRPKAGGVNVRFVFNALQSELHERLEAQRARTGKVRALILKGRQIGISTYVGARFFHRATHGHGIGVYILTHEVQATKTLFGMVDRYYVNLPDLVRPSSSADNANELFFGKLDSGYAVGTAGAKATGRSKMIQLFHGSEVAFWPEQLSHFAGVIQGVPDLPGTEIILESTANGMGDEFHGRWQEAEAGKSDYEAIFLPWFRHAEYRRTVTPDFVLDDDDQEYASAHGLDLEQMAWRRAKITELRDPLLFKQEYPATAAEAFQLTGHDSFIRPELVLKARKASLEGIGRLVIGVDPSRFGADRFALAWRRGRRIEKVEGKHNLDSVAGANWVKSVIDADKPAKVFIDVGGIGAGVYDLLRDWGYSDRDSGDRNVVRSIDFGGAPQQTEQLYSQADGKPMAPPRNRRAEMWMRSRDWLEDVGSADIPDTDELQADACAPTYTYDTMQRLLIESKEHMRKRGVRSPDYWDAVALTFAEPVPAEATPRKPRRHSGGWMGS